MLSGVNTTEQTVVGETLEIVSSRDTALKAMTGDQMYELKTRMPRVDTDALVSVNGVRGTKYRISDRPDGEYGLVICTRVTNSQLGRKSSLADGSSRYRLVNTPNGVEVWQVGEKYTPHLEYRGLLTDIEARPTITGGYPDETFRAGTISASLTGSRDGWFVGDRQDTHYGALVAFAHEILTSDTATLVCHKLGVYPQALRELIRDGIETDLSTRRLKENYDRQTTFSGAKRANVSHHGNGEWVLYGKDKGCHFEGYGQHLVVWAMKVLASENTRVLVEEHGLDRAVFRPALSDVAEELRRYTNTDYSYTPHETLQEELATADVLDPVDDTDAVVYDKDAIDSHRETLFVTKRQLREQIARVTLEMAAHLGLDPEYRNTFEMAGDIAEELYGDVGPKRHHVIVARAARKHLSEDTTLDELYGDMILSVDDLNAVPHRLHAVLDTDAIMEGESIDESIAVSEDDAVVSPDS